MDTFDLTPESIHMRRSAHIEESSKEEHQERRQEHEKRFKEHHHLFDLPFVSGEVSAGAGCVLPACLRLHRVR